MVVVVGWLLCGVVCSEISISFGGAVKVVV